jgi:hypothetical protein
MAFLLFGSKKAEIPEDDSGDMVFCVCDWGER